MDSAPQPAAKRPRTDATTPTVVKHIYIGYGKTRGPDGTMVHVCTDPVRALALRDTVRALEAEDGSEVATLFQWLEEASGPYAKNEDDDPLVKAFHRFAPCPKGVQEYFYDASVHDMNDVEGPFESITMYYFNVDAVF